MMKICVADKPSFSLSVSVSLVILGSVSAEGVELFEEVSILESVFSITEDVLLFSRFGLTFSIKSFTSSIADCGFLP